MKTFLAILKKDLKRFFTDKRIIFSLFLPVFIFVIFFIVISLIMSNKNSLPGEFKEKIIVVDDYQNLETATKDFAVSYNSEVAQIEKERKLKLKYEFIYLPSAEFTGEKGINHDKIIELIKEKEAIMALFIDSDLDKANLDVASTTPNVTFYFDTIGDTKSKFTSNFFKTCFANYLDNNYPPKIIYKNQVDVYTASEHFKKYMADFAPMIILITLVSAIISYVPSVISEEKEKGTLATVLVTPCNRSGIALAKITSTSIIALISIIVTYGISFIVLFSVAAIAAPQMLAYLTSYSFLDYFILIFQSLIDILLLVAILLFITAFARSVKEANNYIAPFMIATVFVAYTSFMISGPLNIGFYFIPLFNTILVMRDALTSHVNILGFFIQLIVNAGVLALVVFGLAKLFNNEKIMYNSL